MHPACASSPSALARSLPSPGFPPRQIPHAIFSGEYVMNGRGSGPDDAPYSGTCSITRDGANYRVSCFNPAVRHTYSGRGVASGDTLAIFIGDRLRGDHNGIFLGEYLVVYRLQPDGSLSGSWVYANGPDEGSETLRPK